jgi:cell division protein FtsZ
MTLEDMTTASEVIYDVVDPEANIIVGAVVDEAYEGEIHVTVIATGFQSGGHYRPERSAPAFAEHIPDTAEERGAKIPPFLINRQNRIE